MSVNLKLEYLGIPLTVSLDTVQTWNLAQGPGANMRRAEAHAARLIPDLVRTACRDLKATLQPGTPSRFGIHVDVSEDLRERLNRARNLPLLRVCALTNPIRQEPLLAFLKDWADLSEVVTEVEALVAHIAKTDLLLLDHLNGPPFTLPDALKISDGVQLAFLVRACDMLQAERELGLFGIVIPIEFQHSGGLSLHGEAGQEAMEQARVFGTARRVHDRFQALRLRWDLGTACEYSRETETLQATLHLRKEERVLDGNDLKVDVGWGEIPKERFSDVAGHTLIKAELQEAVDWLLSPTGVGGYLGKIFYGVPGVGKTHTARAAAGEAGVPFISVRPSEWQSAFWGETERRIRETFALASKTDGCVLVIEEVEAIAMDRGLASSSEPLFIHGQMEALLTSLDSLKEGKGRVLVICTTNYFSKLDPALVRSGRLDSHYHLAPPNRRDRLQLLTAGLGKDLPADQLDSAADLAGGLTQADLARAIKRVRRKAVSGSGISLDDLGAAFLEARKDADQEDTVLSPEARRRVAYHEAGHAVAVWRLLGSERVAHLSLVPNSNGSLGAAYLKPTELTDIAGRQEVSAQIAVCLAGRAAERLVFLDAPLSSGATADIQQATRLALAAVTQWGLEADACPMALDVLPASLQVPLANAQVTLIEKWIRDGERQANEVLQNHQGELICLAETLLKDGTLHCHQILQLLQAVPREMSA